MGRLCRLKRYTFSAFLILVTVYFCAGQNTYLDTPAQRHWADSVMGLMTLEEKVGQLFMVAAYSNKGPQHQQEIESLIAQHHIGGLIFFQGDPASQIRLINQYQAISKYPLLVGMDLEWGLGMRLDSTISFPKQMTLGAIQNEKLIYNMGAEVARQMKLIGVHINFAPVADINSNAANPVIGNRSFGEGRGNVTSKSIAYMKGLQDNGIIANAKHFPGHGDTGSDSHYTMPVIQRFRNELDSVELYPFRGMIDEGLMSTMVAHINIPQVDPNPERPASLSPTIVTEILIEELGFNGLIFTDAMNMKGVTQYYKPGDADLAAFNAGNDVLLFPLDVPKAISMILRSIRRGKITMERLDRSVRKILMAKHFSGLHNEIRLQERNIIEYLNNDYAKGLKLRLFENATTLLKNGNNLIPFKSLTEHTVASLSLNASSFGMGPLLDHYISVGQYAIEPSTTKSEIDRIIEKVKLYDRVVIGLHDPSGSRRKFRVDEKYRSIISQLSKNTEVVLVIFGSPYNAADFADIPVLMVAYEDDPLAYQAAAEVIFGAVAASGTLPVTAGSLDAGTGIQTTGLKRLGWSTPGYEGFNRSRLELIDRVVEEAIADTATPGSQVLIARNGRIIFDKAYGHFTYDSLQAVTPQTVYDIASVTKVIATLQTIMFLEERGMLDMDKKVSVYLPELKGSNKENMILRDILTHQAGLWPYLPFWRRTVGEQKEEYFSPLSSEVYDQQVASGLYVRSDLKDSVWQWTIDAKIIEKESGLPYEYRYSDMGYYMLERIASKYLNQEMIEFLAQNFYGPLGMSTTCYLPLCQLPDDIIAPTEFDDYFRNDQLQGLVHDQGAALMGGVAGHAGIFSTARDLAKIAQMNLQGGYYGGVRYFQDETISRFSKQQYRRNRRGMGWDKPSGDTHGPTSYFASLDTFGHTGFTGTAMWIDPEFDLVFIFLSNRIFPDAENTKLIRNNIRTRIQDLIYQAMWDYEKSHRF